MKSFLMLVCSVSFSLAQPAGPTIGMRAPDFALPFATKDSIHRTLLKLSEQAGNRNIILAFYPADWSTGCTREVCAMRDDFDLLQSLQAEILAISGDYVWSHHEWAKFHSLPFKLLSDHDHEVAKRYNSYNEKAMYNKRTVFVIDRNGMIAYIDLEYNVANGDDFNRLKEALKSMP